MKKKIYLSIMLIISTNLFAQTVVDFGLGLELGFEHRITKEWSYYLESAVKSKDMSASYAGFSFDVGGKYKPKQVDGLSVFLEARYAMKNDNTGKLQGLKHYMRYSTGIKYKWELEKLYTSYQFRYLLKDRLGLGLADGVYLENDFRLEVGIGHQFEKVPFEPNFSIEVNAHVDGDPANYDGFDTLSMELGTDYSFDSGHKIGLYAEVEQSLVIMDMYTDFSLKLEYKFTLKQYKKVEVADEPTE